MKPIIFSEDVKKVLDMIPVAIVEISFGEGITRDAIMPIMLFMH